MTVLYMFVGAILGIIILVILDVVSIILIGRSISDLVFGHSGLQLLVAIMGGCILGFIWGNKVQESKEQARINRELEQDRLKYADKPHPE